MQLSEIEGGSLGQSLFIFRFTDPPDPIFWKLKKNKRFFSILFFYFPSTHSSTELKLSYVF